jgi:hypothetical protein
MGAFWTLLVIEDISEQEEICRIIPICAKCKKIRNDEEYWDELEACFKEHMELDFTHGFCLQCFQEFMGEIREVEAKRSREEANQIFRDRLVIQGSQGF